MKILGIESSCDDTGVAILEANRNGDFNALANVIASQIDVHKKYGGVFPALAKREHNKNLPIVLEKALKEAKILKPQKEIDFIAVTNGPGLEPCLWEGVNFAKELSHSWNIPIVPINHIEAHILVNFLDNKNIKFPAIALVVSGGHTQIILMKKLGDYKILGETRDDAAGECFDKCAKILGLGYPGGPIISKLAKDCALNPKPHTLKLPRPMIGTKDYDFSFSGLKTAVLYADKKVKNKTTQYKKEMSGEIQRAIIDVLIKKTIKALKDFRGKSLILGGGVSANCELKKQFKNRLEKNCPDIKFLAPKPGLSTDNGLMVALTGYFHKNKKIPARKLKADGNLRI
jgi:N6-L-threonylcarbamoyladenine synthase